MREPRQHRGTGPPATIDTNAFRAIREARRARLEALNLTPPAPFDVTIALARSVASAERAVREFVQGQVAA